MLYFPLAQLLPMIALFMGIRSDTPVHVLPVYNETIQTEGNCTCVGENGFKYSLMALRRTDGSPRFNIRGVKYPSWNYTYNPCTPVTLPKESPKTTCHDAALCKMDPDANYYQGIGRQKGVQCQLNDDGVIELVYKIVDPLVIAKISKVLFICDQDKKTIEQATLAPQNEDVFTFAIIHQCACADACSSDPTWTPITSVTGHSSRTSSSVITPTAAPHNDDPGENWWQWACIAVLVVGFLAIVVAIAIYLCRERLRECCRGCCVCCRNGNGDDQRDLDEENGRDAPPNGDRVPEEN